MKTSTNFNSKNIRSNRNCKTIKASYDDSDTRRGKQGRTAGQKVGIAIGAIAAISVTGTIIDGAMLPSSTYSSDEF